VTLLKGVLGIVIQATPNQTQTWMHASVQVLNALVIRVNLESTEYCFVLDTAFSIGT
jgi:hypothetical protein